MEAFLKPRGARALDLISRAPSLGGRTWRLDVYHVTSDCGNRRSLPAFPSLGLGTAGSRRAGTVAGASPDGLEPCRCAWGLCSRAMHGGRELRRLAGGAVSLDWNICKIPLDWIAINNPDPNIYIKHPGLSEYLHLVWSAGSLAR